MRIILFVLTVVGAGATYEFIKQRYGHPANSVAPTPSASGLTLDLNGVPVATVQPNYEAAWATLLPQFQAVPVAPALAQPGDQSETIA